MSLGKACGLDVKYVFEIEHAFNIVKLDGKWYAVDATKKYYKNKDRRQLTIIKIYQKVINL